MSFNKKDSEHITKILTSQNQILNILFVIILRVLIIMYSKGKMDFYLFNINN